MTPSAFSVFTTSRFDREYKKLAAYHAELPEHVILIARPTPEALAELSGDEALQKFWRQLFHARVHMALDQLTAEGRLGDADICNRIAQVGQVGEAWPGAVVAQQVVADVGVV